MTKPTGHWYNRFHSQDRKDTQPTSIANTTKPTGHWYNRFHSQDAKHTQPIPPVQGQPRQTMPQQGGPYPPATGPKNTVKVPWKSVIAALLAFILGVCITSCGGSDHDESHDSKNLSAKYSQSEEEVRNLKEELDQTKDDLKDAKEKADKWDKEQEEKKAADKKAADKKAADKKAAEEKAAADKAAEEKAAADKAAQEKAAADKAAQEKEAQQRAAQQPQQAPRQEVRREAPAPAAPEQNAGLPTVHGGAFCSPAGATGQSDRSGRILTCRTARDGRLRWMK